MALPLIAMAIAGGIRMATPAVAKYLAKQGFKKASKAAVKKTPNAPKMNMTQAKKVAQDKNVPKRPTPANRNYERKSDGSIKLSNGKPILKKPTTVSKSKTGNDLTTQGSRAVAKRPSSAVAKRPSSAVAKRPSSAVAKRPSNAVAKRPSSAVAKRPGASSDKGKIVGLSNKAKAALGATAAAGLSTIGIDSKSKPKSTIADVKRKPALPKVKAKPKKPAPKKPVRSGTGRGNMAGKNMGSESVSEYFGDMQGRKTKVRLPFGMGTVDVDSTKSAYDNDESVEMGQKKGGRMTTVRRRMGGKVRGYGKAMRGY